MLLLIVNGENPTLKLVTNSNILKIILFVTTHLIVLTVSVSDTSSLAEITKNLMGGKRELKQFQDTRVS